MTIWTTLSRHRVLPVATAALAALLGLGPGPAVAEHGLEEPGGIAMSWLIEADLRPARLDERVLELRLNNLDDTAYAVSVAPLEDRGDLQSRRLGEESVATLPAKGSLVLPVRFAARLPKRLSHSGLVVAQLTACPLDGGRCINGASDPLFFHPKPRTGQLLVYGEHLLCARFWCGDLRGRSEPEPGTWRVMGGGPLLDVEAHEEANREDARRVDGGDS